MKYYILISIFSFMTLSACGGGSNTSTPSGGDTPTQENPNETPKPNASPMPDAPSTPSPKPCDPAIKDCEAKQTTILRKGAATAPLSGTQDQEDYFALIVPEGATNLMISLSGGSGDADLYLKFGNLPTETIFDCRPFRNGNDEICDVQNPKMGTYFILVKGKESYTGVKLVGDYIVDVSPSEGGIVGDCEPTQTQKDLLKAHNEARAQSRQCGDKSYPAVSAVRWSCLLAEAATAHSTDMAEQNYFDHTGLDRSTPGDRIERTGYQSRGWGENIAAGQQTVDSVLAGWLKSPGHCSNIMSASWKELGAGIAKSENAQYGIYWTAVFAVPRN